MKEDSNKINTHLSISTICLFTSSITNTHTQRECEGEGRRARGRREGGGREGEREEGRKGVGGREGGGKEGEGEREE